MASRIHRGFLKPVVRACAVALVTVLTPAIAAAAVPWHADLTQAKTASQVSRRPVLVLFVATWSEASINHDKTFLASEESVALLTACFEPVRIDIDADPATRTRLQVAHIPCVCVIDPDERVLARFDCPPSSVAFVAAAGRAAQEAAVACAGPLPKAPAPVVTPPAAAPAMASAPVAPSLPAPQGSPAVPSAPHADGATEDPALAPTPPQWPAEVATAPLGAAAPAPSPPVAAGQATTIEPSATPTPPAASAPSGLASALPNWLSPKPTEPAPAAGATPAETEEKKATGFWATVQKPFTSLVGKPAKPAAEPAAPSEMPSTGVPGSEPGGSMPVGLEGYCAVSLVDKRQWVEGRAKWGVRHRGRTYLFAGPEEQRAFLANPDRYAPGLSGDDPVLATDLGRKVPGQRQYGVSYRSKIYLFSSPDTKAAFEADPQKYSQRVQVAEQPAGTNVR
jgi:YHS domain-containing protein